MTVITEGQEPSFVTGSFKNVWSLPALITTQTGTIFCVLLTGLRSWWHAVVDTLLH